MTLKRLEREVVACKKCRRLVQWREKVARIKVRRFASCTYWGKPCPGFGDPNTRLLLIGLAPAAHGGNRTGRMFTGDRSGDWLFRTLYSTGFANQPESISCNDGAKLNDCYITATCRCAPPKNKLLPSEIRNCRPYLLEELRQLRRIEVIVGLGKVGFDSAIECLTQLGLARFTAKPKFGHGVEYRVNECLTLLGSFHPSQQNTFTGRLTQSMFDSVFLRAKTIIGRR
jgi:uracil-DNA glycosylase family 4